MSDFKLCPNGHHFPATAPDCPYCPKPGQVHPSAGLDKTRVVGPQAAGPAPDKTQVAGPASQPGPANLNRTQVAGHANLNRTQVAGQGNPNPPTLQGQAAGLGQTVALRPQNGRKLVGWLVSFTLDPLGVDFKLYEGRNLIGSDTRCDIVIPQDGAVSGHHLTVLFRMGSFKFKDEMSSNGTFLNDEFHEEGNLADGDVVRIGNTLFLFRAAR